ncbi:MAG: DUF4097 family beta strand repeat-containing protein [Firmicutes bacterium]|nr:DUF4097 family beta strand repeat-containing protein [Bacillota bacterium]
MKKDVFIKELTERLERLPEQERSEIINYYNEMYLDKIEGGMTVQQILDEWGSAEAVAERVLAESGEPTLASQAATPSADAATPSKKGNFSENTPQPSTSSEGIASPEGVSGATRNDSNSTPLEKGIKAAKEKTGNLFKNKTFWAIYLAGFVITFPLTAGLLGLAAGLLAGVLGIYIGLAAAVLGCIVGGLYYLAAGVVMLFTSPMPGLAQAAVGIAAIGIGFAFGLLFDFVTRLLIKLFSKKRPAETVKKKHKLHIIVTACVAALLIVVSGVTFTGVAAGVSWNMAALDNKTYTAAQFTELDSAVNKLDIQVVSRNIEIKQSVGEYKIDYHEITDSTLTITYIDNTLKIREDNKYKFWHNNLFEAFNYSKQKMIIYLPVVVSEVSTVKVTSGAIKITDICFNSKLTLGATSGSIHLENITAPVAEINFTSGSAKVQGCEFNGIDIKGTSGDIHIINTTAATGNFKLTSGDIRGNGIDINATVFELTSGNINASFAGAKPEYTITRTVTSGYSNTAPQTGSTAKTISAKVTSGSIRLFFA